ncbi:acyl-CoA dehydrogenase family protein [Hyphomicrobiales bacterium]|nr:acyl-CoA dehydrogenase family protein [Hyphomicrobiales bacterium]|tara:strand:- start:1261 stop:2463 length:1203 start_codon:yes stop_codon:yes gene_type:complete
MDLNAGPEYKSFREEVIAFLKKNSHMAGKARTPVRPNQEELEWQKKLIENGYAARTIPSEYGGFGGDSDVLKSRIIAEEFSQSSIPMGMANQGISMLVPTLLELGTDEQKKSWISKTINGKVIWCQGYSEPGSGSDLASLQTKAIVDGDDFIINGQKIWTSGAQISDMMFCLVRTEPDAPKHKGISYLLIDMKTPGIEVRPLMTMTGHAEFNEVFFTDVRVPKSQIVGKRGEGWYVANATLTHERGMLGDPNQSATRLKEIIDLMQEETVNGERLIDNPVYLDRLMRLQARVLSMSFNSLRLLTASHKKLDAKMAKLIVKLNGCQLNHDLAGFAIDLLGELGTIYGRSNHDHGSGKWQWKYMFDLGLIIGGGTAQIQKNIISEAGLGMPREPKPMIEGKK